MKRITIALAMILLPTAPATAKKKKPPAAQEARKSDKSEKTKVNDKSTNEGAQGRMNATEDAAKDADSPQFQHRP